MFKSFIRNYFLCVIGTSTIVMASQAPKAPNLTDKDILQELIMDQDGKFTLNYNGKEIEADYTEEGKCMAGWSQGKYSFTNNFLQPLMQGTRPATPAKILKDDGRIYATGNLIEVTSLNTGPGKTFPVLKAEHYGKFACRYSYNIPDSYAVYAPTFDFNGQSFTDVGRTQTTTGTNFIINLIFKPEDVGTSSNTSHPSTQPSQTVSVPTPSRTSIPTPSSSSGINFGASELWWFLPSNYPELNPSVSLPRPSYTTYTPSYRAPAYSSNVTPPSRQPTISAPIFMQSITYTYEPGEKNKNMFYQMANGEKTGIMYINANGVWIEKRDGKVFARHKKKPF